MNYNGKSHNERKQMEENFKGGYFKEWVCKDEDFKEVNVNKEGFKKS